MKVSHEERKPLKQSWLRSQIIHGSQEASDMIWPPKSWGKNVRNVVAR
jgi:hypothetical protein